MNHPGNHTKRFIGITAAVVFFVFVFIELIVYRGNLQEDLWSASTSTLQNVMEQQSFTFYSRLNDQKNTIKIYANLFEDASAFSEEELLDKLNMVTENSTFNSIFYAIPSGAGIENTGATLNVSDRSYFHLAMQGETVIADPMRSKLTGTNIVTFSAPVQKNGRVEGALIGIYDADKLSDLLMPSFGGQGYTYVTTSSGEVISKSQKDNFLSVYQNLFDALELVNFQEIEGKQQIYNNLLFGKSGSSQYSYNGEEVLMHYSPIGINDWYVFSMAPINVINPESMGIMANTTFFMCIIALMGLLVLGYVYLVQKRHMEELSKIAFVDNLTGVPNRKKFKLRAAELLVSQQCPYAFVILDIDKFKVLNDTLGYSKGDILLICMASIIRHNLTSKEVFGRCDSDEFFLLMTYQDDDDVRARVQTIINQIESQFKEKVSSSYSLILCAGVYAVANPTESVNSISDRARHAHLLTKGKDESGIAFYNEEIRNRILEEKEIENKMRSALKNNEFLLYLQPKYYLEDEQIYGAEALVRWNSGSSVIIYPNDFIPVFEKNGFITKLDMYMLDKACAIIQGWMQQGIEPVPISINFSRLHLKNPRFVDEIAGIVQKYQVPTHLIEVELTESTMLHNESVLIEMLRQLHEYGFTLSMDDFGSGYSSLGLLKNLPVDVIKLDRTFFADYSELDRAVTVVSSIISMAKNLSIKTVAEGVETREQIEFLRELGCDIVQGYYYAKPMRAVDLKNSLGNRIFPHHPQ